MHAGAGERTRPPDGQQQRGTPSTCRVARTCTHACFASSACRGFTGGAPAAAQLRRRRSGVRRAGGEAVTADFPPGKCFPHAPRPTPHAPRPTSAQHLRSGARAARARAHTPTTSRAIVIFTPHTPRPRRAHSCAEPEKLRRGAGAQQTRTFEEPPGTCEERTQWGRFGKIVLTSQNHELSQVRVTPPGLWRTAPTDSRTRRRRPVGRRTAGRRRTPTAGARRCVTWRRGPGWAQHLGWLERPTRYISAAVRPRYNALGRGAERVIWRKNVPRRYARRRPRASVSAACKCSRHARRAPTPALPRSPRTGRRCCARAGHGARGGKAAEAEHSDAPCRRAPPARLIRRL
jgi:hypothetical protein